MIKKSMGIITAIIIIFILAAPVFAAPPVLSISGNTRLRAGDTLTLKVYLNGTGLLAADGEITFNPNLITYVSQGGTPAGWKFTIEQTSPGKIKFLGYDDYLSSPVNSKKQMFTITFKVNSNLAAGTNINITAQNVTVSDGNAEPAVSVTPYSINLSPPLSGNANLKSLTVNNATISPGFSPTVTEYSASVPFEVSTLEVTAKTENTGARFSVSGKELSVGKNTVTILVTAANGATKTYKISVTRAQDPNYIPSSNARLKSISLSAGTLSPVFNPDVTEYAVYVPYEQQNMAIGGDAEHNIVAQVKGEERELVVGENRLKITVTAEDSSTKEYFVTVFRMPKYIASSQTETTPEPETTPAPETSADTTASETTQQTEDGNPGGDTDKFRDIPFWTIAVIGVLCAMIGFGGCFFVMRGKKE